MITFRRWSESSCSVKKTNGCGRGTYEQHDYEATFQPHPFALGHFLGKRNPIPNTEGTGPKTFGNPGASNKNLGTHVVVFSCMLLQDMFFFFCPLRWDFHLKLFGRHEPSTEFYTSNLSQILPIPAMYCIYYLYIYHKKKSTKCR